MAAPERERPAVGGAAEAERVIAGLTQAMAALGAAMETETLHLAAGRLREGLALETSKAELAASYVLALRHAKANVVALARFAPEPLRAFKAAQVRFDAVVERNQAVIATAKAVSEGLIRSLADELERGARPMGYGPGRVGPPPPTAPLVYSGRF